MMFTIIKRTRWWVAVLLALAIAACSKPAFKSKWVQESSPPTFTARFETSKGNFDILVTRAWSPKAADRLFQQLRHRFYDKSIFYRVVPNFVVQFGSSDTTAAANWSRYKVPDENVVTGNKKGNVSFARAGKETRGNDLFINLTDNLQLDTIDYENVTGFPAFGTVIQGMEVVESIYSGYGDNTMAKLDTLYKNRSAFLNAFPKLDFINKAYILKSK